MAGMKKEIRTVLCSMASAAWTDLPSALVFSYCMTNYTNLMANLYLTVSVDQESGQGLAGSSAQVSQSYNQGEGLDYDSHSRLGVLFEDYPNCLAEFSYLGLYD